MRQFIAGDGTDSTAAVNAYLAGVTEPRLADLYLIGELGDPMSVWLTNWSSDLDWPVWGMFKRTVIKRGKVTSQVGLQVDSLSVEWSPKLTAFGTTLSTMNPYQLARTGFYDNKSVRLWRAVMPTPGDVNTYGACQWFGGRISSTVIERAKITFTVDSFLDVVNQEVPPNVIESSNAQSSYLGNVPVLADLETSIPTFTVFAPSNTNFILADCIQPTAHKVYADNTFLLGFLVFLAGSTLAGYWSPVAFNSIYHTTPNNLSAFTLYAAFPFAPTPGDKFYVSTQAPVDLPSAQAASAQYLGFPYVPDPVTAI